MSKCLLWLNACLMAIFTDAMEDDFLGVLPLENLLLDH